MLWKEGKIDKLQNEGRIIQGRIENINGLDTPDRSQDFAELVLDGNNNSSLCSLCESSSSDVLPLKDEVMAQLK